MEEKHQNPDKNALNSTNHLSSSLNWQVNTQYSKHKRIICKKVTLIPYLWLVVPDTNSSRVQTRKDPVFENNASEKRQQKG